MNLQATSVTYNSISLGWDMIPFLYRNGPNFQYIVAYRVASSSPPSLTIAVTTNAATLQNLMPFTTYAIYVQGENSAGRGMQSTMLNITTLPAREYMPPYICITDALKPHTVHNTYLTHCVHALCMCTCNLKISACYHDVTTSI